MTVKIGTKEAELRKMREARATQAEQDRREQVSALREKVAAVPARKPKKAKKRL